MSEEESKKSEEATKDKRIWMALDAEHKISFFDLERARIASKDPNPHMAATASAFVDMIDLICSIVRNSTDTKEAVGVIEKLHFENGNLIPEDKDHTVH